MLFLLMANGLCASSLNKTNDPNVLVLQLLAEVKAMQSVYAVTLNSLHTKIETNSKNLLLAKSLHEKVNLLVEAQTLQTELQKTSNELNTNISKIRYLKGMQIIKILYEKVLGLDHHFASVRTFSEINKISNPTQYPEFEKVKELINKKKDKKEGMDLTSILGANPYISIINTFSNLLVSSLSKPEKDAEIQKIECILDFTIRMQNDLNTIYFETAYLQCSNEKIKQDLENLFKDYTKCTGYTNTITICRTQDDWDNVTQKLNDYLVKMKTMPAAKQNKMQIDLEFPIDRLIQFITQYNDFINEGEKFYQKFNTILESYENGKQCESKLPIEYKKLKEDVKIAIEKFNIAYKPVEINGTKMKEILYGINEFE